MHLLAQYCLLRLNSHTPGICPPSPHHPPCHHSQSHLGYMQAPHSLSHQHNSLHTTPTNGKQVDFSCQHPFSRYAGHHHHHHPASSPQDAYTGRFQKKWLHCRSSSLNHAREQCREQMVLHSDDNSSPCMLLLSEQKRQLESPTSSTTLKRMRTVTIINSKYLHSLI